VADDRFFSAPPCRVKATRWFIVFLVGFSKVIDRYAEETVAVEYVEEWDGRAGDGGVNRAQLGAVAADCLCLARRARRRGRAPRPLARPHGATGSAN